MAGEICPGRQDENQSEQNLRRPCCLHLSQWRKCPEEAFTIGWSQSVQSSHLYPPTTRDIYESIVNHLGISEEIVKHGGMSACRRLLFNQLGRFTLSTTKLRDRFAETLRPIEPLRDQAKPVLLSPICCRTSDPEPLERLSMAFPLSPFILQQETCTEWIGTAEMGQELTHALQQKRRRRPFRPLAKLM